MIGTTCSVYSGEDRLTTIMAFQQRWRGMSDRYGMTTLNVAVNGMALANHSSGCSQMFCSSY